MTTIALPVGRTKSPGVHFALQKVKHNLTNATSGAGGCLSPPPPGWRAVEPGRRRELTPKRQVPVARTPGGAAAVLKGPAVKVTGSLNGLPEVNRLLTFNLALTFLEVSGGYVKEQLRLCAHLAGLVKGPGDGGRLRGPEGLPGGSQQDTKESLRLQEPLAQPRQAGRSGYLDCPGTSALNSDLGGSEPQFHYLGNSGLGEASEK